MRSLLSIALLCSAAGSATLAEVPRVVVDIPPVHSLVAQVMEGVGQPDLLLEPGADAHHVTLKPSQAKALQDADLVIWIGPEMTPWLTRAMEGAQAKGAQIALLHSQGTYLRDYADPEAEGADHAGHDHAAHDHAAHDHGAESHKGDDHAGHDQSGHDHGHSHDGLDPHAWLDPANAGHWLGLIAVALGQKDPDNAPKYTANAMAAQTRLAAVDANLAGELAAVRGRPFVVAHDAYGYLTSHYGLASVGSLAGGDAAAPGAAHIRKMQADLAERGVVCAFPEVGRDDAMLKIVTEGSDVKLGAALDPEGRGFEAGPQLYESLLRQMAANLIDCLRP